MNIMLIIAMVAFAGIMFGLLRSLQKAATAGMADGSDFFLTMGIFIVPFIALSFLIKLTYFPLAEIVTSFFIVALVPTVISAVATLKARQTKTLPPAPKTNSLKPEEVLVIKKQFSREFKNTEGINGSTLDRDGQTILVFVDSLVVFKQLPNPYHGVELKPVVSGIDAQAL